MDVPVPFPPSLAPYRADVQTYTTAKIRQFSGAFVRNLGLNIAPEQLDSVVTQTINGLAAQDIIPSRALRLVLRHDCQSTGCGETGCLLCQYNPSRLCKRNIKAKYLIDDHLKAKCGAPLRVELVDETNACVLEGLPAGMQLECHVMNGEKYKEICPENTLLSHAQLRSCIISHHTRALLRRDGGSDDQLRCFLQLERGQAVLSDLQVTTSSEALLAGKAPTFRLLIWAVDAAGEPVPSVTYVVSEYFVVATKRVKHAIKSDIPSVSDHVSKLVHIGKATVDKLTDLRQAAHEEGLEIAVPDDLNSVANVGQFQRLVELSEINTDLKNKVRHLLKLSPEKWEEVCNHAQSAVMPDFRPRAWWCPALKAGLLFACKNGAVVMDQPIALVKMGATQLEEDQVIPIAQLDVQLFNTIPKLKAQAVQSWYAQSHPGWAIYCKQEPLGADSGKDGSILPGALPPAPPAPSSSAGGAVAGYSNANGGGATSRSAFQLPGRIPTPPAAPSPPSLNLPPIPPAGPLPGAPGATAPSLWPLPGMQLPLPGGPKLEDSGAPQPPRVSNGSQGGAPPPPSLSSSGAAGAGKPGTPFAVPGVMGGLTNHFPQFPAPGSQPGAGQQPAQQGLENKGISQAQDSLNLLLSQLGGQSGLVTLPGQEAGPGSAPPGGEITIERGLSQFNSLLVGNESLAAFGTLGPSGGTLGPGGPTGGAGAGGPAGGAGTALPITALAPDNSLNGTLNAFMQDSGDQLGDPAAKRQRLTAPEEVQAAK